MARAGFLLLREKGAQLHLARVELIKGLLKEYADLLPGSRSSHQRRALVGKQEIICRYAPKQALETLPILLCDPADRERFLILIHKLLDDPRVNGSITPEQARMAERMRSVCEIQVSSPVDKHSERQLRPKNLSRSQARTGSRSLHQSGRDGVGRRARANAAHDLTRFWTLGAMRPAGRRRRPIQNIG